MHNVINVPIKETYTIYDTNMVTFCVAFFKTELKTQYVGGEFTVWEFPEKYHKCSKKRRMSLKYT